MRILWVSLVEFPPLSKNLGKTPPAHCGWLYSSAKALLKEMPEVQLGVLVYSYGKRFEKKKVEKITYYLIPSDRMDKISTKQISACKEAIVDFCPNLIHIHGTEYSLAEAVCRANDMRVPSIVNIQGLAGPYTRYADGGVPFLAKLFNITPLDFLRDTFMFRAKKHFKSRSKCEDYILENVHHIVGRTTWDRVHTLAINPKAAYHFMNETLRDSFYQPPFWKFEECKRYTIFVSNSGSPLKGAHQVLRALPLIMNKYPDVKVRFCGSSVMNNDLRRLIRMQGYHLYLRRLVKKLHLESNVEFLGQLSELDMKRAFLEANVYVMSSAIENSPNSLCEAQILGVPAIASFVGGVPDLVTDGSTGFTYRYEEIEMLANLVLDLFEKSDLSSLSETEHSVAMKRHDRAENASRLCAIYRLMIR